MDNEKYVVLNRQAYYAGSTDEIEDAVVIRTQDAFAAAGLSAYAHLIDLYASTNQVDWLANHIKEAQEYLHAVAAEAEDRLARGECKLPD